MEINMLLSENGGHSKSNALYFIMLAYDIKGESW